MMRKLLMIFSAVILVISCSPKQQKVERYMENGVEVIVNRLEPYKIKGEPGHLILEEEFTLDTERDEIAELGLTYIGDKGVDSEGNIYITNFKNPEGMILKFDRYGNFVTSFARGGQGPGEFHIPLFSKITDQNEIVIADSPNRKLVYYSKDGELIKEIPLEFSLMHAYQLGNGNYVISKLEVDISSTYVQQDVCLLCDSKLKKIKELARRKYPSISKVKKLNPIFTVPRWSALDEKIYIGKRDERYEILIYNSEGNLLRKIIKEYEPVEITDEDKETILKEYKKKVDLKKIHFPKYWPPFESLLPSDDGKLFVKTYVKSENPTEYIYDIFNPDGIYIGEVSLKGRFTKKKDLLYCVREKESGYTELVVYKMRWE